LRRLLSSGALRGAVGFALGGAGFALGNILLAAALPPAQFGLLSLLLALMLVDALLLFAGAALAGSNNVSFGVHQSRAQVGWALALAQGPNYMLLLLALAALWLKPQSAGPILIGVVVGYLLANLLGWWHAAREQGDCVPLQRGLAIREGIASVSIGIALQLLWQLERVAIPKLTTVDDLATYSVLAAVVGAPFRVTQFGVGFTLIERLRKATDAGAARAILRHEIVVALLLVCGAVAGILIAAPIVFHVILKNKYPIGWDLVAITIAVGMARVAEGFSTTAVAALGTERTLARISAVAWVSLGVGVLGAWIGSRAGLFGIVCGTLFGWLSLSGCGCVLAVKSFRQRFAPAD